ncbi:MAG: NUDIX domain-containing protein [Mycobacteriaceae bacterium]
MSEPGVHEFTVQASRTAYVGTVMALRVDEVQMPGGATGTREVIEHYGAVAVLAIDDANQVVLIHQYRHPMGRRLWELPAGLLDVPDEEPLTAAQRELAEEVGIAASHWSVLVDLAVSPGFTDESVRVYLAEGLSRVERAAGEHEEADVVVHRVPLDDAVAQVLSGEIVNTSAVAGLLALAVLRARAVLPRNTAVPWTDRPRAFGARKR